MCSGIFRYHKKSTAFLRFLGLAAGDIGGGEDSSMEGMIGFEGFGVAIGGRDAGEEVGWMLFPFLAFVDPFTLLGLEVGAPECYMSESDKFWEAEHARVMECALKSVMKAFMSSSVSLLELGTLLEFEFAISSSSMSTSSSKACSTGVEDALTTLGFRKVSIRGAYKVSKGGIRCAGASRIPELSIPVHTDEEVAAGRLDLCSLVFANMEAPKISWKSVRRS